MHVISMNRQSKSFLYNVAVPVTQISFRKVTPSATNIQPRWSQGVSLLVNDLTHLGITYSQK